MSAGLSGPVALPHPIGRRPFAGELWGARHIPRPVRFRTAMTLFQPQLAAHPHRNQRLTGEIIALETELNDRVYRLFDLTP